MGVAAMETDDEFEELRRAFAASVREWKRAHPQATLNELDQAIWERAVQLQAQAVSDLLAHEPEADWAGWPEGSRPRCAICDVPLRPHGRRKRPIQGRGGEAIPLERT